MRNIYTPEAIKETATYRELESKNEIAKMNFLTQRVIRGKITHAVQVHKNTGSIPNTVSGIYLTVVKDIINSSEIPNSSDYSNAMTAEDINLYDV